MLDFNPKDLRVALLAGGTSSERDISLLSAQGAMGALVEAGFTVTQIDPSVEEQMSALTCENFDVAFLVLHGKGGEDGTIQAELEARKIPYTGSGVEASRRAISKDLTKEVYCAAGLPTPVAYTLKKSDTVDMAAIVEKVGQHCVVKAVKGGSTLGISIAENEEEIAAAIESSFAFDDTLVIEQFVAGPEFTVAVIGGETDLQALPVIQIIPANGFYDFEAKYAPGGSLHKCPAEIDDALAQVMKERAMAAHKALGCHGVSRTDFIVDAAGEPWMLETNTIPGMTKTSLLPEAARVSGIEFPQLCCMLIAYALEKAQA